MAEPVILGENETSVSAEIKALPTLITEGSGPLPEGEYACSCTNYINIDIDGRIYYCFAKFIQHGIIQILPHSRSITMQKTLEYIMEEAFDPASKTRCLHNAIVDYYKETNSAKAVIFRFARILSRFYEEIFPLMKVKKQEIVDLFELNKLTKVFIYNLILDMDQMQVPENYDRISYTNFIEDMKREFKSSENIMILKCVKNKKKKSKK